MVSFVKLSYLFRLVDSSVSAPEHDHLADALHGRGIGPRADGVADRLALLTIVVQNLHFDQLVRRQRAIDFGDDAVG